MRTDYRWLLEDIRWLVALTLTAFLSSSLGAQEDQDPFGDNSASSSQVQKRAVAANDKVREILSQKVNFSYDETPFIDVMDAIREHYNLNVILDQSARDDSLTEDDVITFNVKNVRFTNALRLMLMEYHATYVVQDGVLKIISADVEDDSDFFVRKIINCRELIQQLNAVDPVNPDHVTAVYPLSEAHDRLRDNPPTRGGGVFDIVPRSQIANAVGNMEEVEGSDEPEPLYLVQRGVTAEARLMSVIKASIAPQDWEDTNGDGSIVFIGRCMIINQKESVIAEVEQLLKELSETIR